MTDIPKNLFLNSTSILDLSRYHSNAESHIESCQEVAGFINAIRGPYNNEVADYFEELDSLIVSDNCELESSFHECDMDKMCNVLKDVKGSLLRVTLKMTQNLIIAYTYRDRTPGRCSLSSSFGER